MGAIFYDFIVVELFPRACSRKHEPPDKMAGLWALFVIALEEPGSFPTSLGASLFYP
jgi:hypothetical protein